MINDLHLISPSKLLTKPAKEIQSKPMRLIYEVISKSTKRNENCKGCLFRSSPTEELIHSYAHYQYNYFKSVPLYATMELNILLQNGRPCPPPNHAGLFSLPVVFQECDLLPIRHCEAIFWSLIPIDIINPIGTVVVSGYDNIANQKLSALILEVFFVLLIHGMPL